MRNFYSYKKLYSYWFSFLKSGQENLFSFENAHKKPPSLINQKITGLLYVYVHSYIWSVFLCFKLFHWSERTDHLFEEYTFLSRPKNDLSWISGQKNKPVTYLCAKKHTGSKVAAFCFCKVAIRNNKLELLDVACNFIKRNSGIGFSCGFEKIFKTNFNETVPGN